MYRRRKFIPKFFIEALAGIIVLLSVNHLWFSDNFGYIGVSPNPYWLVVIFIAMRYGDLPGLLSGFMCAAVLLISTIYNTAVVSQDLWYHIPYQQWKLAGLFIVFGFLAGQERSRMEKVIVSLREKFNKLRGDFESLAVEDMALKQIKNELEGRILSQTDTVNTIYEVAKNLTNLDEDQIYPAVPSLVRNVLGSGSCAFYVWDGNSFVFRSSDGSAKWPDTLETGSDVVKIALTSRKVATVRDVLGKEGMSWDEGKDPPMVAPLFFGAARDSVSGIIVVSDMPFTRLNPDAVNFLSIMSDWISHTIDNIYVAEHIQLENIFDPETGLFRYEYGRRRLREEILACSVKGCGTALMLVQIADMDRFGSGDRMKNYERICAVLRGAVRGGDIVSLTEKPDMFMAIFPGADRKAAEDIRKRIVDDMGTAGISPYEGSSDKLRIRTSAVIADSGSAYADEMEAIQDAEKVFAG